MISKQDKIGTAFTIAGFVGIIALGIVYNSAKSIWTFEVMSLLIFTIGSFVLGLHFTMHDYEKEFKKKDEKDDEQK